MEQISMFHYNYPKINSSLITTVNSEILLKYLSGNPQDLHSESVIYFPLPIHRLPSLLLPLLPRNWQVRQVFFGGGGEGEEGRRRGKTEEREGQHSKCDCATALRNTCRLHLPILQLSTWLDNQASGSGDLVSSPEHSHLMLTCATTPAWTGGSGSSA